MGMIATSDSPSSFPGYATYQAEFYNFRVSSV